MTKGTKVRRWHRVTMEEAREIWTALREAGLLYNGCTHAALQERYGAENVRHRMGYGWYKLVAR